MILLSTYFFSLAFKNFQECQCHHIVKHFLESDQSPNSLPCLSEDENCSSFYLDSQQDAIFSLIQIKFCKPFQFPWQPAGNRPVHRHPSRQFPHHHRHQPPLHLPADHFLMLPNFLMVLECKTLVSAGFESSQIFNLHIFASGIFGYLLNGKTTCIFNNFSFMNRNSEISCCFKAKLTLSSLRLQLD